MKLTELRCPTCGGPLTVNEKNPLLAKCEYCEAHVALEWEGNQPHFQPSGFRPGSSNSGYKLPEDLITEIDNTTHKAPKMAAKGFIGIIVALLLAVPLVTRVILTDQEADSVRAAGNKSAKSAIAAEAEIAETPDVALSGCLGELASYAFGLPMEDLTEKELSQIQWIEMKYMDDSRMIGYSFDTPETEGAELIWKAFPRNDDMGEECFRLFTGLKYLVANCSLQEGDLEGVKLESLSGYYETPQQAAAILGDPSSLRELEFPVGANHLNGLEVFTGLESLSVTSSKLTEADALVSLPGLKRLELNGVDSLSDFSVFSTMDQLEELSIDSENLKALNFLGGMKSLKYLTVENAPLLTLDGLSDRPELLGLSILSCNDLKDMNGILQLTGLKELSLELPYGCEEPDLTGFTGLEHLTLEGFGNASFLKTMTELKSLTLDSCSFSDVPDLSGLTRLTELTYSSFAATDRSVAFLSGLPALEKLNMGGISTYDDISGIFNMATLKELNISGMECEINFDRIRENQTLEKLSMNDMLLYKNVNISGGGGIVYVDWDDVVLDENTEFLSRLKGLRHLSLRENTLTDISFAAGLVMLETLDISDNYVTELRPLAELKNLRQVTGTGNPISNKNVLSDKVDLIL